MDIFPVFYASSFLYVCLFSSIYLLSTPYGFLIPSPHSIRAVYCRSKCKQILVHLEAWDEGLQYLSLRISIGHLINNQSVTQKRYSQELWSILLNLFCQHTETVSLSCICPYIMFSQFFFFFTLDVIPLTLITEWLNLMREFSCMPRICADETWVRFIFMSTSNWCSPFFCIRFAKQCSHWCSWIMLKTVLWTLLPWRQSYKEFVVLNTQNCKETHVHGLCVISRADWKLFLFTCRVLNVQVLFNNIKE